MHMFFGIFHGCTRQDQTAKCDPIAPVSYPSVDLREEYANAFRTESYQEFWARVLDLSNGPARKSNFKANFKSSNTHQLSSYRLFAEHLLDPDQPTATKILTHSRTHPGTHTLLTTFFSETANASILCGLLLKDIDQIRSCYRPLKSAIESNSSQPVSKLLADFKPFNSSTWAQFKVVQTGSTNLLEELEVNRRKIRAKIRIISWVKHGFTIFFVALVASACLAGAFIAFHGLVALLALPVLNLNPSRLNRVLGQLDAAAKGIYILNRDLDTISRLVERLHDEVQHIVGLVQFWKERDRAIREVVREIWKTDVNFITKLDELEEHLYLCFMTINKARGIVVRELLVANEIKLIGG